MSKPTRRSHREATSRGKGKQKSINADYGDANSEEDPLEELTRPQLLEINRVFDTISGNLKKQLPTKESPQDKSTLPLVESTQIQPQIIPGDVQGGGFVVEDQDTFGGGGFLVEEEESGDAAPDEPGGFLAEEDNSDNHQAGGFLLEDTAGSDVEYHGHQDPNQSSSSSRKVSNYISTRKIPDALKMLGLPYRNSEILDIFENAASSDEDEPRTTSFRRKEKMISRIKFSKVCAVLMMANSDNHHNTTESEENTATDQVGRRRARAAHDGDDQNYDLDQDASDQASSSASDYQPHRPKDEPPPTRHRSRRANPTRKSRSSPSNSIPSKTHSNRRQAKAKKSSLAEDDDEDEDDESAMQDSALQTFALFLQPTPTNSSDISNRTIGFDEIRRAADQLGETMSDEEIFEMLNYASYTNNSRVTFHAFEKLIQEIRTV